MSQQKQENTLLTAKHTLLHHNVKIDDKYQSEYDYILNNFCGTVCSDIKDVQHGKDTLIYLCGDIAAILSKMQFQNIRVISELSYNMPDNSTTINLGQVPINIHNVGVLFRKFFSSEDNYFNKVSTEHEFQTLRQSNKTDVAFRKGIYLTKVEECKEDIKFKLLRCSTNLSGPTENFGVTDQNIVSDINQINKTFFEKEVELNHVLAQIYYNTASDGTKKEKKAKIAKHSDKTKDMPDHATMAFCTFYKDYYNDCFNDDTLKHVKLSNEDRYNHVYKQTSVLTCLRFILKKDVKDDTLAKSFDIILYPNSVFMMSLQTNRLYTHQIVPSGLPVNMIPTRLGYVIRCSNTDAVFSNDHTHIVEGDKLIRLTEPTEEGLVELKELYLKQNKTVEHVDYAHKFYFSMNEGDYEKPVS